MRTLISRCVEYILTHFEWQVLSMFSDALKILDQNTVQFMIEEQAQQLEQQTQQLAEQTLQLEEQFQQLDAQYKQLNQQALQIVENNKQLDQQALQIDEKNKQLDQQSRQLEEMKEQISESAIESCISTCQALGLARESALSMIIDKYHLTATQAEEKIELYWH